MRFIRNHVGKFLCIFLVAGLGAVLFHWTINRVYVPEGNSLQLRYKGPLLFGARKTAKVGHFAQEGEIGILAKLRGPGRHFYCPIWWERTIVKDEVVEPGSVAIVRSALGENPPEGEYLVDGKLGETNFKGILRKVYGPGRYRANPYAYQFKKVTLVRETTTKGGRAQTKYSGWVEIPTGYVGVVTNLTDNPITGAKAGIQENVLPPGIYPINSREQQVDIIEIGYRETTVAVKTKLIDGKLQVDKNGEPIIEDIADGINFPSTDGFDINMDFTAIWGIMPDGASQIIKTFGNVDAVEDKVVLPQVNSICRNKGSQHKAEALLVGKERQKFQTETQNAFKSVLEQKNINLLYGLIRHIYIPQEVRLPIQNAFVANELQLTRDQETETAKEEASYEEAVKIVALESKRVEENTARLVAAAIALGDLTVGDTKAETTELVAAIDKKVADLEAQATVVIGKATAAADKVQREASANKFKLAVEAFGTGEAYNRWVFASGLPDDVKLQLLYAGEGTFWTDLKGFSSTLLGKQEKDRQQERKRQK
jgi:hypothetical protein